MSHSSQGSQGRSSERKRWGGCRWGCQWGDWGVWGNARPTPILESRFGVVEPKVANLEGTGLDVAENVSVYLEGKRPMEEVYPAWPRRHSKSGSFGSSLLSSDLFSPTLWQQDFFSTLHHVRVRNPLTCFLHVMATIRLQRIAPCKSTESSDSLSPTSWPMR